MSKLRCIVYFSSATRLLTESELEALLIDARDWNMEHGVSGVLLHHDGSFMQYIEGADYDLRKTFKRITDSSQHMSIVKVLDQSIEVRSFPDWVMGYSKLVKSELIKLNTISWAESKNGMNDSKGMQLLKYFWDNFNKR